MRKDLYYEMFELEERYWWHVAKRRLVEMMIGKYVKGASKLVFMDVGCGTGKLLQEVKRWRRWKRIVGLDGAQEALKLSRKRGIKNVKKADFEKKLPVKDASVGVITSLDVVEHIKNDQALIQEFNRMLVPGGWAIVTVPAYKKLWTYWDDMLGHKRRYRRSMLEKRFVKAGFKIEKISYFYSYLLPMALAFRALKSISPKWRGASDFVELPEQVNEGLLAMAKVEAMVVERVNLPAGLSIVCVAKKVS